MEKKKNRIKRQTQNPKKRITQLKKHRTTVIGKATI